VSSAMSDERETQVFPVLLVQMSKPVNTKVDLDASSTSGDVKSAPAALISPGSGWSLWSPFTVTQTVDPATAVKAIEASERNVRWVCWWQSITCYSLFIGVYCLHC
jgi:hypothetical protein